MPTTIATRAIALYLPITLAFIAGLLTPRSNRRFAAILLSFLWTLPALLLLQQANQRALWWTFTPSSPQLEAIPVELYLGWAVLWGVLPQLAFPTLPIAAVAAIMAAIDLIAMPACHACLHLNPNWLIGETVAVTLVLIPSLLIARWTLTDRNLRLRAIFQIAISGLLFLYLLPELAFALRPQSSPRWTPLLTLTNWQVQLAIGAVLILAIPGISAVFEFADRGLGTPIPYDPPQRLVTTGLYRYIVNPMQLSCTAVMFLWAILLHNPWLAGAAAIAAIYSAGIAEWDEREDLAQRFGEYWRAYRRQVHAWHPNLFPYAAGPIPRLYIASTCGPCTELRTWLESKHPQGLDIHRAEDLPQGSIQRLRYDPADGTPAVEGVRALARALEHIHIGWALAGATLRLPILWRFIQLVMDAAGLGPRMLSTESPGAPGTQSQRAPGVTLSPPPPPSSAR